MSTKDKILYSSLFNLDYDQILRVCDINKDFCDDNILWDTLLQNYNKEFYEIIKDYQYNTKDLYLNFLEIKKDKKEKILSMLIQGDYDEVSKLEKYKEVYTLYTLSLIHI